MAKKRQAYPLAFPLVIGLWLTGCFEEPKLKADTEANFESSYAILVKDMSSADRERLDTALKDIALVETAIYGPLRDAKLYRFPSGEAGAAFQAFGSGIDQAMGSLLDLEHVPPELTR
jgi:hypothetical protein